MYEIVDVRNHKLVFCISWFEDCPVYVYLRSGVRGWQAKRQVFDQGIQTYCSLSMSMREQYSDEADIHYVWVFLLEVTFFATSGKLV